MAEVEVDALENRDLLTVEQVAERLSMSVRSLQRMVKRGKFPPPIRYTRRLVRWKRTELTAWVDRQRPVS